MYRKILIFGAIAGLLVGGFLYGMTVANAGKPPLQYGMLIGYASMLVALSLVFVGIKRHRDQDLGGAIRFLPALFMGLGISFVAGILYVVAWEAALATTGMDFAAEYGRQLIDQQRAAGASEAQLAALSAQMASFAKQYANPMFRMPMTFVEIYPVGVVVSLVSAALLRRPGFMPAKR